MAKVNRCVSITTPAGNVSFIPTTMVGFSHVAHLQGKPGPVGWIPSGTRLDYDVAVKAARGDFFA